MGDLATFKDSIGVAFNDDSILETALTHSSYARSVGDKSVEDNERLEFYGDAVLKLIVSEYLFNKYPDLDEGALTHIRSHVVSDKSLSKLAKIIQIGDYMRFSNGEKGTGGKKRPSNLANALEAFLGAYYIDQGLKKVSDFFIPLLEKHQPDLLDVNLSKDHKTTLQEYTQKKHIGLPRYKIVNEKGPDHEKTFTIEASIDGKNQTGSGKGRSKKDAEQNAAKDLLNKLGID